MVTHGRSIRANCAWIQPIGQLHSGADKFWFRRFIRKPSYERATSVLSQMQYILHLKGISLLSSASPKTLSAISASSLQCRWRG